MNKHSLQRVPYPRRLWVILILSLLFAWTGIDIFTASTGAAMADAASNSGVTDVNSPTVGWVEQQSKQIDTQEVEVYWQELLTKY